ncbi:MAG: hypothetical protein ABGZ23_29245, partial [Fuerstiella sp.]
MSDSIKKKKLVRRQQYPRIGGPFFLQAAGVLIQKMRGGGVFGGGWLPLIEQTERAFNSLLTFDLFGLSRIPARGQDSLRESRRLVVKKR